MDTQATWVTTNIVNDDKNRPKPKEKSTRKRLNYRSNSASGPLSPIESYIAHQKQKIKSQEAKNESLEEELAEYTIRRKECFPQPRRFHVAASVTKRRDIIG